MPTDQIIELLDAGIWRTATGIVAGLAVIGVIHWAAPRLEVRSQAHPCRDRRDER